MKNFTLLVFCSSFFFNLTAQVTVNDSVTLGPGYANMVFYNLPDGAKTSVSSGNWDLQIWTTSLSASIRVNDNAGVMLYQLQNDDTLQWNSVDTTGMTPLYNVDTTWEVGAFNALSGTHPDYGWGTYTGGGNLKGYRLYVIKTYGGNYKKVWVKRLVFDGSNAYYEVTFADLDNSNETDVTLTKTDYPTKSFLYYDIDSDVVRDIEPARTDWDLVFRRYWANDTPYVVMGILSHPDVTVAEARGIPVSNNNYASLSFSENISQIGWNWKNFNIQTFLWELRDSLAYFVEAQDGNIYKLVFTGFGGQATGTSVFTKTQLTQVSTGISQADDVRALTVYPNPAVNAVQALFTLRDNAEVTVRLFDLSGKSHFSQRMQAMQGINNLNIPVADYAPGFYLLSVDAPANKLVYKFVKTN